jgi:hypothetical protein
MGSKHIQWDWWEKWFKTTLDRSDWFGLVWLGINDDDILAVSFLRLYSFNYQSVIMLACGEEGR